MWSEICELMPLTTGLDACIEHDIEQFEMCAEANRRKGDEDTANSYIERANELKRRKQTQLKGGGTVKNNLGKVKENIKK